MLVYLALIDNEADRSKFQEIYRLYYNKMLHTANQILRDRQAAEDVTHQAFLKIIENLERIVEVDCHKTKAFVVIIVERLAVNEYRRRRRHPEEDLNDWTNIEHGMRPDRVVSEKERLSRAMAMLPEQQREIMLLKYHMGYRDSEIARMFDVTEDAVRQSIARGKRNLARRLQEDDAAL